MDNAEISAFRGVGGNVSWLTGQETSGCVLSSVSIAANSATTDCGTGLCMKHGSVEYISMPIWVSKSGECLYKA